MLKFAKNSSRKDTRNYFLCFHKLPFISDLILICCWRAAFHEDTSIHGEAHETLVNMKQHLSPSHSQLLVPFPAPSNSPCPSLLIHELGARAFLTAIFTSNIIEDGIIPIPHPFLCNFQVPNNEERNINSKQQVDED